MCTVLLSIFLFFFSSFKCSAGERHFCDELIIKSKKPEECQLFKKNINEKKFNRVLLNERTFSENRFDRIKSHHKQTKKKKINFSLLLPLGKEIKQNKENRQKKSYFSFENIKRPSSILCLSVSSILGFFLWKSNSMKSSEIKIFEDNRLLWNGLIGGLTLGSIYMFLISKNEKSDNEATQLSQFS